MPHKLSSLELAFDYYWNLLASDCHVPEAEVLFAPKRKFRFDRAWKAQKLAVELEGGVYSGGRHVRGAGFERDLEKMNLATVLGWRVLRYSSKMLNDDPAGTIEQIKRVLKDSVQSQKAVK